MQYCKRFLKLKLALNTMKTPEKFEITREILAFKLFYQY